jgi:hypothetical protein
MGISLNGLTPAGTYPGLIKTGDNTAISGTPKVLSDGNGNNLPMEVSTTGVNLTGSPTVNSVAIANTTQVAAKQDTLVSGTNIKTINGASLLGSGNIPVVTSPSGVAGAIQFSNGSAFASDAANLFWDDTNNRLGVGTNAPNSTVDINSNTLFNAMFSVGPSFATGFQIFNSNSTATPVYGIGLNASYIDTRIGFFDNLTFRANGTQIAEMTSSEFRVGAISGARVGIKGSGSTSATTSLLVQNSVGASSLQVKDDGSVNIGLTNSIVTLVQGYNNTFVENRLSFYSAATNIRGIFSGGQGIIVSKSSGVSDLYPSSIFAIDSTTQGFLPPRMTNAQRSNISSPAVGLMVYCTDAVEGLYVYKSTGWTLVI